MPFRRHRARIAPWADPGVGPIPGGDSPGGAEDVPVLWVAPYHPQERKPGWSVSTIAILVCTLLVALGSLMWLYGQWASLTASQRMQATVPAPALSPKTAKPGGDNRPEATEAHGPTADKTEDSLELTAIGGSRPGAENPFTSEVPVQAQNGIDAIVFERLAELDIKPAKLCSDEVFLRRIYIDALGTLPTVEEAKRFLDDPDPHKRSTLIDEVLERPEFADYWTMKWCDILRVKAEFPIKLWPNAAQAYHHWVRTALERNMPYDDFVFELLTASGSNFRTPQVNFYRAVQNKEPKALAQAVALTFLCQRADEWPAERLEEMSVFFSQVGYKPTGEWKEEIVFFDPRRGTEGSEPKPLAAVFPGGDSVIIPPGQDPRQVFAQWLASDDNPWFARAIANRVWYWLHGHGIIEPPDDIRPDDPPSNAALLDYLADELVAADYDLRHLYRLILNSQTYQLSCLPESEDPRAGENFAYYPTRRLDAEVLIDAICQITGTTESYSSIIPEPYTFLPDGQRAVALPDGSITSSFLEMFGRPARDTGLESERNNHLTAAQALHLLNSNHLRNKLKQGPGIRDLLSQGDGAESLYLAILSRRPSEQEWNSVIDSCVYGDGLDVAWALINSDEFLFRH